MSATAFSAVQAGGGLWGSFTQAEALKDQGKIEERLANQNARLNELQSEDAILRGSTEAAEVKRRGRAIKGSQRAALAGQGVAVDTGTAAAIQAETDAMSTTDALTVKNNAFREAWGFKTAAIDDRFQGRMKRIASKNEARQTLLTGGLNAANDISRGMYLNSKYKNTGYTPKNSTEARFNRDFQSKNWKGRYY